MTPNNKLSWETLRQSVGKYCARHSLRASWSLMDNKSLTQKGLPNPQSRLWNEQEKMRWFPWPAPKVWAISRRLDMERERAFQYQCPQSKGILLERQRLHSRSKGSTILQDIKKSDMVKLIWEHCLPKPNVQMNNPIEIIQFWPLVSWVRCCQYPMNQATGMDARDDPRE